MRPFKPVPFHQTRAWTGLAKRHKQLARRAGKFSCVDCGVTEYLESDHVYPRSRYPELALDIKNLVLRCRKHNAIKGNRVYRDWHGIRVAFIFSIRKLRAWLLVGFLVFCLHPDFSVRALFPSLDPQFHCPADALLLKLQDRFGLD